MQRTQIYLESAQQQALQTLSKEKACSISELIREAIWDFIGHSKTPKPDPLSGIIGLYHDTDDKAGSVNHDDIYE